MNDTETVRFILIGHARTGTGYLRTLIDDHPDATCLGEVLHTNNEEVRQGAHSRYFQDQEWFRPKLGKQWTRSAVTYIESKLWPEARPGCPFGFKLLNWQLENLNLWEYLRLKRSEIRLVHITRNPIAVFVSHGQARLTNQWAASLGKDVSSAKPVLIEMERFKAFTRDMFRAIATVRKVAERIIDVTYEDLINHRQETINSVYQFLELPPYQATSTLVKQQDWDIRSRIANFDEFAKKIPRKYKRYLENML